MNFRAAATFNSYTHPVTKQLYILPYVAQSPSFTVKLWTFQMCENRLFGITNGPSLE